MIEKIREYLGLYKHTEYERNYLDDTNTSASVYMSVVVIVLETWMILRLIGVAADGSRTAEWIISHFIAYFILWVSAVAVLAYSIGFLMGKIKNRTAGRIMRIILSIVCVIFGMYISRHDYMKGEQILTFLTMLVFVACIFTWRPIVSLLILTLSYGIFYLLIDNPIAGDEMPFVHASTATRINFFIMWISVLMVSLSVYFQRLAEGRKTERLEQANKRLNRLVKTDDLTGLANKHYFIREAARLCEKLDDPVYLYINLNNFRSYNEKYGFSGGNGLLKDIAAELSSLFNDGLCARFGEDHFVVLCENKDIENRLKGLNEFALLRDVMIKTGLRVGAFYKKKRDITPQAACDNARHACDSLKKTENLFCVYDEKMELEQRRRQYIVNNIDNAIKSGYIKAYYQPVVWTSDKKICSAEVLARWDDPEFGLMSPGVFVPVLEEYNQIHKLDAAIIDIACADMRRYADMGAPLIPFSVNFSRRDFELMDVPAVLDKCVKKYGIKKELLHIEITESAITDSEDMLQSIVASLKAQGYPLWLDDFGSGYSSLNVLKDFSFDVLKLDMKFLSSLGTNTKSGVIIDSVLKMARQIGMHTLSEGVETTEEMDFLENIGCERLQGYLIGRPMPIEQLFEQIDEGKFCVSDKLI